MKYFRYFRYSFRHCSAKIQKSRRVRKHSGSSLYFRETNYSATTSNSISFTTSLWNLIVAV